ncbi:MAG TPA: sodium:proton antiporter [Gemmatimonadales bacterium]|nr:sodium:proton antiporter [Gemmatimonadales bacterium]
MTGFDILAALVTLAAVFAWINYRFVKLPTTIGVMVIALVSSLALVAMEHLGFRIGTRFTPIFTTIDFNGTLLNGMLGALLFAGALHLDIGDLLAQKGVITALATLGVVLSTVIVGFGARLIFGWLGFEVPIAYALLFGALISPTDPIAVGAILKTAGVPKSLETKITGESLFNDGIGVVMFIVLYEIATGAAEPTARHVSAVLAEEVVGGVAYGAVVGWIVYRMLKSVDNYQVEILITLALVTGGYALAHRLHVSGPLAMVVAGLLIGNHGRALAMSSRTRERLDAFWELIDEFLNAVLFVLIGIEVLLLELQTRYVIAALLIIPLALFARWASAGTVVSAMRRARPFSPHAVKVLTWSGLRGGISVALALSIPAGPPRALLLTATYVVVCFSIIGQGLTIGPYARRLYGDAT